MTNQRNPYLFMIQNINKLTEYLRYFVDCHQSESAPIAFAVNGCRDSLEYAKETGCYDVTHPVAVVTEQYVRTHLFQQQPNLEMMEEAVRLLIKQYRGLDIEGDYCELLGYLEYGHNVSFNPPTYKI